MQFTYKCTGFQFSKITCQKQTFSFISLKTCIMLDKQDLKNGSFFILQKKKNLQSNNDCPNCFQTLELSAKYAYNDSFGV